jgi:N,N'-diacetyllegionaminate synthase
MVNIKKLSDYNFKTVYNTYVIAEIGINHNGDLKTAIDIVKSAAKTGCDAVKFQTYISEKRAPKKKNKELYDILKKCELSFSDFTEIKKCCDEYDIEFISTAFDEESIDFLNDINMDIFKISSFDLINHKLLKKIASLNKTNIISVGMGNKKEIAEAYNILSSNKNTKNAILHCISSYPTPVESAKLASINYLKNEYDNCIIGQSDHTSGIIVPAYAVAAGAQVIEKHYKINTEMDCIDSIVSITEEEMINLVKEIRNIEKIFGSAKEDVLEIEKGALQYRRSNIL